MKSGETIEKEEIVCERERGSKVFRAKRVFFFKETRAERVERNLTL